GHLVDRLFELGREVADQVEQRPDFELAMRPEANSVCFRHIPESMTSATPDALNAFTAALRQKHLEEGPQYVVMTRFGNTAWLRCTLMNPLTEPEDLEAMLDRIAALARDLTPQ
ncbi:MAG: pyridoxal-dependent decarboxylase, partial [Bacteroidota bacterium]|nr:pyridoxal-dependent decarboxylase [Bacteroidota bacterium]